MLSLQLEPAAPAWRLKAWAMCSQRVSGCKFIASNTLFCSGIRLQHCVTTCLLAAGQWQETSAAARTLRTTVVTDLGPLYWQRQGITLYQMASETPDISSHFALEVSVSRAAS